jgi:hypothetical protein
VNDVALRRQKSSKVRAVQGNRMLKYITYEKKLLKEGKGRCLRKVKIKVLENYKNANSK